MFKCNVSKSCKWSVSYRYKGQIIDEGQGQRKRMGMPHKPETPLARTSRRPG
jgi:hypothetical protein